jgi:tetratricopeptide (TPR) repeat protein
LLAAGCDSPAKNNISVAPSSPAPAQNGAEGAELAKIVQASQQAGYEKHDLPAYLSIWADDARSISGRTEKPDKYDTVLTRAQVEAIARLRFAVPPPKGAKVEFKDVQTEVKRDEVTVRYRVSIRQPRRRETSDEIFRLQKKDGKWKVVEHRSWPVEYQGSDYILTYEATTWKAYDDRVGQVATLGEKLAALIDGKRHAEAHAAAKEWTKEAAGKAANTWFTRGLTAMSAGDAADARASFKKALELDPEINMPEYARAAGKEK